LVSLSSQKVRNKSFSIQFTGSTAYNHVITNQNIHKINRSRFCIQDTHTKVKGTKVDENKKQVNFEVRKDKDTLSTNGFSGFSAKNSYAF
jgi:hypothetical protein